jgi:hypothetical protein
MRISTKVVFDMETMQVVYRESYEYNGPVDLATGLDTTTSGFDAALKDVYLGPIRNQLF